MVVIQKVKFKWMALAMALVVTAILAALAGYIGGTAPIWLQLTASPAFSLWARGLIVLAVVGLAIGVWRRQAAARTAAEPRLGSALHAIGRDLGGFDDVDFRRDPSLPRSNDFDDSPLTAVPPSRHR